MGKAVAKRQGGKAPRRAPRALEVASGIKVPARVAKPALALEGVAREIEELMEEAPRSLAAHMRLFHRLPGGEPMIPAAHHWEWIEVLEDPVAYPFVVVVAPPGYGKSSIFSQAYAAWRLGQSGGTLRMGLVANTADLAQGHSQAVQQLVEGSRLYRLTYGHGVLPHYSRGWAARRWHMMGCPAGANPTMVATGIRGNIQGRRLDEIILDDPTTFEESRSEEIMERQRGWLKNTLVKRFEAGRQPPHSSGGSRMVVVCTRWSERDLVPTLTDELGFKLVRMPALGYWDRRAECPECGRPRNSDVHALLQRCEHCDTDVPADMHYGELPLWPPVEPIEQLRKELHDDEIIFRLVKQGDPKALAGDMFTSGMFMRGHPPRSGWEMVVQYVDTAGGKARQKGDFFCMVTLGRRGEQVWVLDVDRGRYPATTQERRVLQNGWDWDPDVLVIEDTNEGTALYQRLVAQGTDLPLKPVPPAGDKEFRALPLANAYRAGYVWHPEYAPWRKPFESELESFPGGRHDDQVDAAAGAFAELDRTGPRARVLTARG